MAAHIIAADVAAEIVVSEHYDELRDLLTGAALPRVMVAAFLKKNFPAHSAALAAGDFTTTDLLDALDNA